MKPPFRAEAICAGLIRSGIPADQIVVHARGGFRKSFSDDVAELDETGSGFELTVNRDSLYDKLPEGLFHQTKGNSRIRTIEDAVQEHKRYKEEERLARKFFSPLEQLLFRYQVLLEKEEQDMQFDLQGGRLNRAWFDFWNFDTALPGEEAGRMLQLMPYLHAIKGNPADTAEALAYILNKKVLLREAEKPSAVPLSSPDALAETRLGGNSTIGDNTLELFHHWVFSIEGTTGRELLLFVPQPGQTTILQKFEDLFVPFEIDVQFEFDIQEKEAGKDLGSVLGYGAHI
ncbi:hypothetical protein [Niabella beijingensis]|uniref:hypothetical protein n=1 Tax=Niabella beijingensis TaxID=2872700 RepID=UPI001CBEC893|nr:hypothetical protein [Niabella beijingensis]MBZ4188376.1 hypothetical protein [Niabella beijingensis]